MSEFVPRAPEFVPADDNGGQGRLGHGLVKLPLANNVSLVGIILDVDDLCKVCCGRARAHKEGSMENGKETGP